MALVGPQRIAKVLGCTQQHVTRLVEDGMPRKARGKYDLEACATWYIRHLRESLKRQVLGKDAAGAVKLRERKADIAEVDAEMKRLDLAERRQNTIRLDQAARLWEEAVARMRTNMLATIPNTARRCLNIESVAEASVVIEEVVHEALLAAASAAEEIASNGNGIARKP